MQIALKLDQVNITLGNNGIILKLSDSTGHRGDLRIGRATVVWMHGKTTEKNGKRLSMAKFIKLLDDA